MKEPLELQDDVARALRMLGQAATPEGMEARLAGRLQQRRAELNAAGEPPRSIFSGRMVFAGAIVAVCVMVAVLTRHRGDVRVKHAAVVAVHDVPPVGPQVLTSALPYRAAGTTHHARVLRAPLNRN